MKKIVKNQVVFDFDGTLLFTDDIVSDSFRYMFSYYGFPPVSDERIRQTFGGLMIDEITTLKNEYNIKANPEEMLAVYRSYHGDHFEEKIRLFDGVKELLDALIERGCDLYLLTSRKKNSTYRGLKHFGIEKYFSLIVTADDSPFVKPDKRAVLSVLEKSGNPPENAVLIGDSHFDIECAKNANITGIHAVWGRQFTAQEIQKTGATFVVETPEKIIEILENL